MAYIRNILLLLITINIVIAQDNRPSVAVLDFDAKGIPAHQYLLVYTFIKFKLETLLKQRSWLS